MYLSIETDCYTVMRFKETVTVLRLKVNVKISSDWQSAYTPCLYKLYRELYCLWGAYT